MKKENVLLLGCLLIFFTIVIGALFAETKTMDLAPTGSFSYQGTHAYEYSVILSTTGVSDWVLLPGGEKSASVTVSLTGGATAKVQTTTDNVYIVKTSTASVTAIDWSYGTVSVDSSDNSNPVTAFRLVQLSTGTAKMTIRSQ